MEGRHQGRRRQPVGAERRVEGHALRLQGALRGWTRHQSGGADRRGACRLLHDGAVGRTGTRGADGGQPEATVTLDKAPGGFAITKIHLDLVGKVPGTDQAGFEKIANDAKVGCPVSKLFKGNTEITLSARLES